MAYFDSTKMITDPDNLYYFAGVSGSAPTSANIIVDYSAKTIQLKLGATSPGSVLVVDGGATLKSVYSKMKEIWKSDATLIKFPFPMLPITDEQFELINGWDFADTTTKQLIRTGGWALKSADGNSTYEKYAGIISLGSLAANTDQIYYTQDTLGSITVTGTTNVFALTGPINQAVKFYGDVTHGNFDYKSYLKLFVREYEKTYASSTLTDIGVTELTYQAYRFPVSTVSDTKITTNSPPTAAPYDAMSIQWYATPQSKTATNAANYNIVINANGGTAKQVYEFIQYKLRHGQRSDIDANATASYVKYGEVTPDLLRFVGDNLYVTYQSVGPTGGIFIDNIAAVDVNNVYFYDNTNAENKYPYSAVLRVNLGDNALADLSTKVTVFFTDDNAGDNTGRDYGTANAMIVNDKNSNPMTFTLGTFASSASVISNKYYDFEFDYDSNNQRGEASKGVDAPVTAVSLGLSTAQFVKTTGTIAKSKSNSVSLINPLERNYSSN